MATLESDDSNIIDGESINLRLVVYPILAVLILVVGGFGYYYYHQYQRNILEAEARAALLQAKSPEALEAMADKYPGTDEATLALLSAAEFSYGKLDYAAAIKNYKRVIDSSSTAPLLRDSATLGLASSLDASGKVDDAIAAYLDLARRGNKTPYAPFAYNAAAQIYAQRNDSENERKILVEEAALDSNSVFVKQAQARLKELMPSAPISMPVSLPGATTKQ